MALVYIQQNGSLGANTPYPNTKYPKANIAESGCGCCSSLMVLLNSTKYSMTIPKWAKKMIECKARYGYTDGTDMTVAGKMMASKYGFDYHSTTDINELKTHLKNGYKAVAHVGNNGYFSSSGHYVCVAGITDEGKAIVLDPYYYANKWNIVVKGKKRNKYFKYNPTTHEVVCDFSTIAADSKGCKYHLFKPNKKVRLLYSEQDIKNSVKKSTTEKSVQPKNVYSKWTGYTTASTLNIRVDATTNSNIIGTLSKDTAVTIEGEKGDFYKITYKGKTAYISKQYVTKTKPQTAWTGIVTASALNVRSKPNTSAKILGVIKNSTSVKVSGENGGFYVIKYKNQTAYVSKKYIKKK